MSKDSKFKRPFRTIILISSVFLIYFVFTYLQNKFQKEAIVCLVEKGTIRDSVTGNVRVLAALRFEIRSETQSKLEYAALIPHGKPIQVEANQTVFSMETIDLEHNLKDSLNRQKAHDKRLAVGSSIKLQLELEEQNLEAYRTLSNQNSQDIAEFELEKKSNLVEILRKQLENEKIHNEEISISINLEIERLENELRKRKILSPIRGTLVSSSVKKGDTIFNGQVMGEIQSTDRIIEVTLNEEDFSGIEEGQKVGVTLFSFGNQVFEGVVKRLSAKVDPQTGRRTLFVDLNSIENLPVGASGRAEIVKAERTGTLILPRKALLGNSVFALKDGKTRQVKVVIGARNLEFIEIKKGLKEKDRVIAETPHLFYNGEKVNSTLLKN